MSSSSSSASAHGQPAASSSRSQAYRQPAIEDEDELDGEDGNLLDEDPLGNTLPEQ
jgi:chloride channel 3/4/5